MPDLEIQGEFAEPVASTSAEESVLIEGSFALVRRRSFMLVHPEPAAPLPEDADDIRAARAALSQSGERIPYENLRRDLGLA
jgi:hypothetical protein